MGNDKKGLLIAPTNHEEQFYSVLDKHENIKLPFCDEILFIENSQEIENFELHEISSNSSIGVPIKRLVTPYKQGYGGNLKTGFQYAIANGFEAVAQIDCLDPYFFKILSTLFEVVIKGNADACFGSSMKAESSSFINRYVTKHYVLRRILASHLNRLLSLHLSDYQPACRVYSLSALKDLPFRYNSDDALFDTEIIIQYALKGLTIKEIALNINLNRDISSLIRITDTWHSIMSATASSLHVAGIFYQSKFDGLVKSQRRIFCKIYKKSIPLGGLAQKKF